MQPLQRRIGAQQLAFLVAIGVRVRADRREGLRFAAAWLGACAAILVALGYSVLKRMLRLAIELLAVVALLAVANYLGWFAWPVW